MLALFVFALIVTGITGATAIIMVGAAKRRRWTWFITAVVLVAAHAGLAVHGAQTNAAIATAYANGDAIKVIAVPIVLAVACYVSELAALDPNRRT